MRRVRHHGIDAARLKLGEDAQAVATVQRHAAIVGLPVGLGQGKSGLSYAVYIHA